MMDGEAFFVLVLQSYGAPPAETLQATSLRL
jgi:hypothetical protein